MIFGKKKLPALKDRYRADIEKLEQLKNERESLLAAALEAEDNGQDAAPIKTALDENRTSTELTSRSLDLLRDAIRIQIEKQLDGELSELPAMDENLKQQTRELEEEADAALRRAHSILTVLSGDSDVRDTIASVIWQPGQAPRHIDLDDDLAEHFSLRQRAAWLRGINRVVELDHRIKRLFRELEV